MKLMGIHGSEKEDCGCETKSYHGGKIIIIGCSKHNDRSKTIHKCKVCDKVMSKKDLQIHKWGHTVK